MGLASLGRGMGIFCDFLFSVLLSSVILGLNFLALALFRPQVHRLELSGRERAPRLQRRQGGARARLGEDRGSLHF